MGKIVKENIKEVKRAEEENHLEMLFKNYEATEKDRVDFDWGKPRGIEIL